MRLLFFMFVLLHASCQSPPPPPPSPPPKLRVGACSCPLTIYNATTASPDDYTLGRLSMPSPEIGPLQELGPDETCDPSNCEADCDAAFAVSEDMSRTFDGGAKLIKPTTHTRQMFAGKCVTYPSRSAGRASQCQCHFESDSGSGELDPSRGDPTSSAYIPYVGLNDCGWYESTQSDSPDGCTLAACNDYFYGRNATFATFVCVNDVGPSPPPSSPVSPPSSSSGCDGGCVGGIVGGCFVPVLMCILWLSGAFAKFGCASPFVKKSKDAGVTMTNINGTA